ncbi:Fusaridione A synthetase fsdS [Fusarium oxysporum f. sp. albedinis]|nr:Fusaridione A synthetase fsdS [Fusarium oxysporum f. sp. albedinis]
MLLSSPTLQSTPPTTLHLNASLTPSILQKCPIDQAITINTCSYSLYCTISQLPVINRFNSECLTSLKLSP